MNVYFFLGHTFYYQSIAMAQEIKQRHPESKFYAMVAARSDLMRRLDKLENPKFSQYDWLSSLEKQWLSTPLDKNKLNEYEKKLGKGVLRRLITADREVGVGFVSGGRVEKTKLIQMTESNHEMRWRYIIGLVEYLFKTFQENKIDIAFAYCIAAATSLAIAEVARALGIKFCQLTHTRIGNYSLIDDNSLSLFNPAKTVFDQSFSDKSIISKYYDKAKKYLEDFRNSPVLPQEQDIIRQNSINAAKLKYFYKTLATDMARWIIIKSGFMGTKGVLRQRFGGEILIDNIIKFWTMRKALNGKIFENTEAIGGYEYVYFPLHVDPEASTMVLADLYTDQMAIIEALAKSMPANMRLVVKEHIPVVGKRKKGFYQRIKAMPDVVLLSPFCDNFTLIKNAAVTAVITGTAAIESMMLGRPTLIIGRNHFTNIGEGFVFGHNLSDLTSAIDKAINQPPANTEKIIHYIASLMTVGYEMSLESWEKEIVTSKEVLNPIVDSMEKILSPDDNIKPSSKAA